MSRELYKQLYFPLKPRLRKHVPKQAKPPTKSFSSSSIELSWWSRDSLTGARKSLAALLSMNIPNHNETITFHIFAIHFRLSTRCFRRRWISWKYVFVSKVASIGWKQSAISLPNTGAHKINEGKTICSGEEKRSEWKSFICLLRVKFCAMWKKVDVCLCSEENPARLREAGWAQGKQINSRFGVLWGKIWIP